MKIRFTKAPTFTKAITAAAVFAVAYLASTSSLPSCSDTIAVLNSGGGQCLERPGLLHTASGWLALICLAAAVLLLALKHKDHIAGWWQAPVQPAPPGPQQAQAQARQQAPAPAQAPVPAPVPGRAPGFCAACGTRIIAGDRFCQGCGASTGPL